MKFDLGLIKSSIARYLISIGLVMFAFLSYEALVKLAGGDLPTYITFYPALIICALFAGFWATIVASAIVVMLVAYWILPPEGLHVASFPDALGVAVFSFNGILIAIVAELYRRARQKSAEYAAEIALLEERKKTEKILKERSDQLEAANKELESFSYSVSHDLRAPLRAIEGYSRMILKKDGARFGEETQRFFQMIRSNAETMGRLIEDLLDFSRLTKQEIAKKSLDMEELVGEVWQELVTIHPCREMTLRVDQMPAACGDRTLVRQVYSNLLGNAVKFTQGRTPAVLEAGSFVQNGETVYYVRDNGPGFDMRFHDKLFVVFQRLHGDEEYKGTGIGLALVQRIVNRHGGRIWAEGEVDKGATFYFTLPIRKD